MSRYRMFVALAVTSVALTGCDKPQSQPQAGGSSRTPASEIAQLPDAAFAGGLTDQQAATIQNPLGGNPDAIARGHALFLQMNCASCHGYDLSGGMGPNLTDGYWRYGGTPGAVFQTIYSGRPQGMPAWRHALSSNEIWQLVAYIQSKGGTVPATQYAAGLSGDAAIPDKPSKPPPPPDPSQHDHPTAASPHG